MGEAKRRREAEIHDGVVRVLVDKGKLIEAGWAGLRTLVINKDAPQAQLDEMRMAFFAGAQHLFGAIMGMLDPGEDPTEADLRRMDLIKDELDEFISDFKLRSVPTEGTA